MDLNISKLLTIYSLDKTALTEFEFLSLIKWSMKTFPVNKDFTVELLEFYFDKNYSIEEISQELSLYMSDSQHNLKIENNLKKLKYYYFIKSKLNKDEIVNFFHNALINNNHEIISWCLSHFNFNPRFILFIVEEIIIHNIYGAYNFHRCDDVTLKLLLDYLVYLPSSFVEKFFKFFENDEISDDKLILIIKSITFSPDKYNPVTEQQITEFYCYLNDKSKKLFDEKFGTFYPFLKYLTCGPSGCKGCKGMCGSYGDFSMYLSSNFMNIKIFLNNKIWK